MAAREQIDALPDQEHQLIHSALQGDRESFAVLVERYWDRLFRWLFHLTHNRHSAEDLAQETFLKAFANLARFRSGSNFHAWLFRIGYNTFVNHWRGEERARQAFPNHLPQAQESPIDRVLTQETMQLLARAVGRLPADYRAALLLRAEEGLSFHQIAQVLGIKEETARWRVFKARQKLMGIMAPQMDREQV